MTAAVICRQNRAGRGPGSDALTDADELLTARELAAELKVSLRTLERWRAQGIGPVYVRLGRTVRYRRSDVNAWLERQRQSESE